MLDRSNIMTAKEIETMMTDSTPSDQSIYEESTRRVAEHLDDHKGEPFTLDDMCRWISARSPIARKAVSDRLRRLVAQGVLEKENTNRNAIYRTVSLSPKVNWKTAITGDELPINWPRAHGGYGGYDATTFGFDGKITIRPTDLIVVAGVSNAGKSVFARNFLAENLDIWSGNINLIANEYSGGRFKATLERMSWVEWDYGDGTDRFDLYVPERDGDWKSYINPDGLNIIDWIAVDGEFYKVRNILKGIQGRLRKGCCMVVIQKNENKGLGEGGIFSEQLAAVYLNIDKGKLTVRKVKEPKYGNTFDGMMYGFKILDGAEITDIQQVKECTMCRGKFRPDCSECEGKGYSAIAPPVRKGGW